MSNAEKESKIKAQLLKKKINALFVILKKSPAKLHTELHIVVHKDESVDRVLRELSDSFKRDFFFVNVTKEGFKPKNVQGAFIFGDKKKRGRPRKAGSDDLILEQDDDLTQDEEDFYD